jgi:hypothetical protein
MAEPIQCFWKRDPLSMQMFINFLWNIIYPLHPLLGADEVSSKSWQLIAAIEDECDGLTLCG